MENGKWLIIFTRWKETNKVIKHDHYKKERNRLFRSFNFFSTMIYPNATLLKSVTFKSASILFK